MVRLAPRTTIPRWCHAWVFLGVALAGCGEGRLEPEPIHFETIISGPAGIQLSGELIECFLLVSGQPLALASTLSGVTEGMPERNLTTADDSDIAEVLGVHLQLTKMAGEGVLQAEIRRNAESVSSGFASDPGDEIDISASDPGRC